MKRGKIIVSLMLLLTMFSLVSSVCCEKTDDGAWCQDVNSEAQCNNNYNSQPTSCDQTSYCVTGTCIDQDEGICMPNTPKKVCEDAGGFWENKEIGDLPQCQYGCCFYADQAAFATQSRCQTLGSIFGLNTTYRPDITDEFQCLASAGGSEKGACVIERDGVRDCRMLTKSECNAMQSTSGAAEISFNEGYLCSAEFLGTRCGPRGGTTCIEGTSEVYFKDTCGNIANIYDVKRLNDPIYWEKMFTKEESCGYDDMNGNAGSSSCGNCEYLLGSMCEQYERGENIKPSYGDYVCADLSCKYKGKTYKHGESWCESSSIEDKEYSTANNVPGIRALSNLFTQQTRPKGGLDKGVFAAGEESYVLSCYNGEVLKESCSTGNWRNQICAQEIENGISYARCESNLYIDCVDQLTEEDCLDYELRDCKWIEGYAVNRDSDNNPKTKDSDGNKVEASCVPRFSPAHDFWNAEGNVQAYCSIGTRLEVLEYDVRGLGSMGLIESRRKHGGNNLKDQKYRLNNWDCKGDCRALEAHPEHEDWMNMMDEICASLGDCSASENYLGYEGYHDPDELLIQKFVRIADDLEGAVEEVNEQ